MSKELEYDILTEMQSANMPVGASYLSLKLTRPQATIGRILQELEYKGYIVKSSNKGRTLTEQGRQYYERLYNECHFEEFTQGLVEVVATNDEQIFMDILNIRLLLEPYAIKIATNKITPAQIRELEIILERQLEKQSAGELGEAENLEFHSAIVRLSGNKVIEQILKIIMLQNNAYLQFPYILYRVSLRENEHTAILQAIKERDGQKAEELMYRHIMALVDDFEKSNPSHHG